MSAFRISLLHSVLGGFRAMLWVCAVLACFLSLLRNSSQVASSVHYSLQIADFAVDTVIADDIPRDGGAELPGKAPLCGRQQVYRLARRLNLEPLDQECIV